MLRHQKELYIKYNALIVHEAGHAVMAMKNGTLMDKGIEIFYEKDNVSPFFGITHVNLQHYSGSLSQKRLRQIVEIWSAGHIAEKIFSLSLNKSDCLIYKLDKLTRNLSYNDMYMSTHAIFGMTDGITCNRWGICSDLYQSICLDVKEFLCSNDNLINAVETIKLKGMPDQNRSSISITKKEIFKFLQ